MRRLAALGCAAIAASLLAPPGGVLGPTGASAIPSGTEVRLYRGNLEFAVDMAWVPRTKKIFFTEKNTGRVRVLARRRLRTRPCVDLDVNSSGERGALGILLHPRFKKNHWLYVYYTQASPLQNRVTRFTVTNNRCRNPKHVVTGISASSSGYHNGGQLVFWRGKLMVGTGEAHDPDEAQDTNNRLGKILRYNPDGSIPRNNPFSTPGNRNPVWSYGHRNPFGLAAGPRRLYQTENGPDCDDELNLIRRGRNYGWGANYVCGTAGVGSNPKGPLRRWTPTIVPTDLWWYRGRMARLSGSLYMGDYANGRLHRFTLRNKGRRIRSHRVIYDSADGITSVSKGPGGWLYFVTPGGIYRIVPA